MRSLDRLFIGVLVSLVTILGCDSTVAIDTTRPSVRKAIVYGACAVGDQSTLSQVRMSVLLEADDGSAADPSFQLFEQERLLGELMSAEGSPELRSPSAGRVLFPKYPDPTKPLPSELYRLATPIEGRPRFA